MNFDNLYSAIIYLVCCYFLFWLGKLVYDLIHKDINVKMNWYRRTIALLHSLWLVTILV